MNQPANTSAALVSDGRFAPALERRSVLDRAHRGDVIGALGRIDSTDGGPRRTRRRRVGALLAVLGPGLVVMVADNDAGGISTYAQMGRDHGLIVAAILVPLAACLFVNQEMAARLGAVTGAGHARLIRDRFGRGWGAVALVDLLVLNLVVLVTELIGIALGFGYLGVDRRLSVPVAAGVLVLLGGRGSFRTWERSMLVLVAVSLVVVPLLALVAVHRGASPPLVSHAMGAPGSVVLVLAFAGTTVAPWQLFFHQSTVVDKRITPRLLRHERTDTGIGVALFLVGAVALIAVGAIGARTGGGGFADAGTIAATLGRLGGHTAGVLFAVVLIDGSLLGAGALSLTTAYAIGDVTGTRHSLHRSWRDARTFHASRAGFIVAAAAITLIPGAPLGVLTTGVQVLAAVLLPSALVFLLLLANDRDILGPWTNPRWLNVMAAAALGALLALSALLLAGTAFPRTPYEAAVAIPVLIILTTAGAVIGALLRLGRGITDGGAGADWTMPRLEQLPPAAPSAPRRIGLLGLRAYVVAAVCAAAWQIASAIRG